MSASFSSEEYARLATADRARITSARTLLAAGREAEARALLTGVQVLEQVRVQERKAA